MEQLVIKNGMILATHPREVDLKGKYPGCEVILCDYRVGVGDLDPRTREDKANSYADKRRMEYPFIRDQLDMMYWDKLLGMDLWLAEIGRIKDKYPKPEKKDVQEADSAAAGDNDREPGEYGMQENSQEEAPEAP